MSQAQSPLMRATGKAAYALTGMAGDRINADTHRFRVTSQAGRRTLDRAALREHWRRCSAPKIRTSTWMRCLPAASGRGGIFNGLSYPL